MIHIEQCRRYTFLIFYMIYLLLWAKDLICNFCNYNKAYMANRFEREAYQKQILPFTEKEMEELGILQVEDRIIHWV